MHPRVKSLLERPLVPQRSPEWFKLREKRITASEAASCFQASLKNVTPYLKHFPTAQVTINATANPYCSYEDFMRRKLGYDQFKGNKATEFGTLYEPMATRLYEKVKETVVHEFGFMEHETIPFIGASPDGITPDGVMLEIKCPFKRVPNGVPPLYYYIQMQLQLEVCDLDMCHYLECEIKEVKDGSPYPEDAMAYGWRTMDGSSFDVHETIEGLTEPPMFEQVKLFYMKNYYISDVPRDKEFFESILPSIEASFHDWQGRVEEEKATDAALQEEIEINTTSTETVNFLL